MTGSAKDIAETSGFAADLPGPETVVVMSRRSPSSMPQIRLRSANPRPRSRVSPKRVG